MNDDDKYRARYARMLQTFRTYTLQRCKSVTARDWQKLVRLEAIESDGLVSCVTCDWRGSHKECDAGHFIPRRHSATLFDRRNCHVQCRPCNHHLAGNLSDYRRFMRDRYGIKTIRDLERLKSEVKQFTKEELVHKRLWIRDRIKVLEESCARDARVD